MKSEALDLARALLDALADQVSGNGACFFCGRRREDMTRNLRGRRVQHGGVRSIPWRGRQIAICYRCQTSLGWTVAATRKREGDRYGDRNFASFDDLPELIFAEWSAKRLLSQLNRTKDTP